MAQKTKNLKQLLKKLIQSNKFLKKKSQNIWGTFSSIKVFKKRKKDRLMIKRLRSRRGIRRMPLNPRLIQACRKKLKNYKTQLKYWSNQSLITLKFKTCKTKLTHKSQFLRDYSLNWTAFIGMTLYQSLKFQITPKF